MRKLLLLLLLIPCFAFAASSAHIGEFKMDCQAQYYNWQYVLLQIKILHVNPDQVIASIPQEWSEEEKKWAVRAIEEAMEIPDSPDADYRKYVRDYICKQTS